MRAYVYAVLCSASMLAGIILAGSAASAAMAASAAPTAHSVSLADATVAPTRIRYLRPGQGWTVARDGTPCPRDTYFSDVSAYRWNGRALGAQRWSAARSETYWIAHDDFAVTFDGVRFFNDTTAPVLVVGWCE